MITIPSTGDLVAQNIANLEARLGQSAPIADRAFVRVLAATEAMAQTSLYKYGADRVLANFVQSAAGADLDYLGGEYGLSRQSAAATQFTVTLAATDGTVIPAGTLFNCQSNGLQYKTAALITAPSGAPGSGVILTLSCTTGGSSGNLPNGTTIGIQSPIAGAGSLATVTSTTVTGADAEGDEDFRVRILDIQRSPGGGGNSADYRNWAQAVAGVKRAYPYSGANTGGCLVFIECAASLNADGIAPAGLLTQVRSAILADPATGISRPPLGIPASFLTVSPISRTGIYVNIYGLFVSSGMTANCQADITTALTSYLAGITPFVAGLDPTFARCDMITVPSVSAVVQSVIAAYGATISSVSIGLNTSGTIPQYQVSQGEKLKLAGVQWS